MHFGHLMDCYLGPEDWMLLQSSGGKTGSSQKALVMSFQGVDSTTFAYFRVNTEEGEISKCKLTVEYSPQWIKDTDHLFWTCCNITSTIWPGELFKKALPKTRKEIWGFPQVPGHCYNLFHMRTKKSQKEHYHYWMGLLNPHVIQGSC